MSPLCSKQTKCGFFQQVRKNENEEVGPLGCHDMLDNLLSVQGVHQDTVTSNVNHCCAEIPSFNGIDSAIFLTNPFSFIF